MNPFAAVLLAFLLMMPGLALIATAIITHAVRSRARHQRVSAAGTVIELVRVSPRCSFSPLVEFTTPAGATLRFQSAFSSRPAMYQVGQTVPVLFNPSDPKKAEIDAWMSRWFQTVVLLGMGGIFLVLGTIGAFFILLFASR
jgi:hypothetical protein